MEVTFFGTAAAEGWPAPFCRCPACVEARRRGGPNLRGRAGAMIDHDFKIDFSADTVSQMQRTGRDLADVRTLVFTHQHSDHIVPTELEWTRSPFTNTPPSTPIAVYGNSVVHDLIRAAWPRPEHLNLDLRPAMQPFESVSTEAGDTLLPLPADHVEGAFVLRITRGCDGKTVFWGHDSGIYPEETVRALAAAGRVDMAVFDCTYGGQASSNRGHLGVDGVIVEARRLREAGVVDDETVLIATHFSHNGGLLHEELVDAFLPHGIRVAFDGAVFRV
ncbi:MAG: MBL fold metallo-hydrolase [Armatimonadota bacterium]